jgi:nucleotide-binding universal stress UspA family protein
MVNTVAVGTDGTPTASQAVATAIDLAERNNARLVLISSYRNATNGLAISEPERIPHDIEWAMNPVGQADAILAEAADGAQARGLPVIKVARAGNPADVLCNVAAEQRADVLVIGNKGMHRRVLGSIPNSVAHNAPCSVLIVKTT